MDTENTTTLWEIIEEVAIQERIHGISHDLPNMSRDYVRLSLSNFVRRRLHDAFSDLFAANNNRIAKNHPRFSDVRDAVRLSVKIFKGTPLPEDDGFMPYE